MRAAAFTVLAFGLMFLGAGLVHGLTDVSVANGTSCGSAFSGKDVTDNYFSDENDNSEELCDATRDDVRHLSAALVAAGIVGVLVGLLGLRCA